MAVINPSSRTSGRKRIGAIVAVIALLGALLAVGGGVASATADSTGSISGTVQGAGSPNTDLANAYVSVYSPGLQWAGSTTTDANGNFSVTGLAAGSYTLDVQAPDGANYVEQWWNGKPDNTSADYFPLADGQALTGMNVVLPVGSTLSGSVLGVGSPNVPIQYGSVFAARIDGVGGKFASTDGQGNFTISGLAAGPYTLEFSPPYNSTTYLPQWWQNQSSQSTAQTINVGPGQTLTGYNALLPLGASISGSVLGSDTSAALPGASVQAQGTGGHFGFANVGADGSYTINQLAPGTYTVVFKPAQNTNYLPQYWNNQPTQDTAMPVTVAGGDAVTGINATLAVGGTVSGVVTTVEAPGVGLAGASAYAVDSMDNYVQGSSTDADGNYSIVGLAPGAYRIQFQPPYGDSHASQFWKGATTFDKATPITVGANTAATGISASLTQGGTVSGIVTDATTSLPVDTPDVEVETPSGTPVAEGFGDSSGNYTVTNLPAGTFVVKFQGTLDAAYTPSWWQNASKLGAATRIKVTAGSVTTGINGAVTRAYLAPGHATVSGPAKVGSTLTAKPGKWKPSATTFTYQWNRDGSAIAGATNTTYVPVDADAGHALTVSVTGDYFNYDEVTVTSAATKAVTGGTLTTAVPQITGTPTAGSVLTAVPGTWGPGSVTLTYRWSRGGSKISGATGLTYVVTKAGAGKQIAVTVTGSETGFTSASQTSAPTAPAS